MNNINNVTQHQQQQQQQQPNLQQSQAQLGLSGSGNNNGLPTSSASDNTNGISNPMSLAGLQLPTGLASINSLASLVGSGMQQPQQQQQQQQPTMQLPQVSSQSQQQHQMGGKQSQNQHSGHMSLQLPTSRASVGNPQTHGLASFIDPLEHSLASFEKNDATALGLNMLNDLNTLKQELSAASGAMQAQSNLLPPLELMTHLQNQMHQHSNNGFNNDFNGNGPLNGMGNLASSVGMSQMLMNSMVTSNPLLGNSGLFDPLQNFIRPSSYQNNPGTIDLTGGSGGVSSGGMPKKEEGKFMLTPKPIEDLLMNPNEKKMSSTPPDGKGGFGHAFKSSAHDQNLKNAWSSLASAGSPQSTPTSAAKPKPSMDTFQAFRNKAKEKLDRQKLLLQQEMKRNQKEQAEKELKRQQEQQQKVKQDEINNGRKMSIEPMPARVVEDIKASPQGSPSPGGTPTTPHALDRSAAKRAELRKLEQERRRREAMAGQIDMNMQSDLMAAFEESL